MFGKSFYEGGWKGVDCSEGKVEVGLAWRLNCFSLTQTTGSRCVFRESMTWQLSTWSKLEPACFMNDKMASEIRWLGHLCACSLPWVGWVVGTSWGLFLFSAYLRAVGQGWSRPFINAPPPWPYWGWNNSFLQLYRLWDMGICSLSSVARISNSARKASGTQKSFGPLMSKFQNWRPYLLPVSNSCLLLNNHYAALFF